jgi:PKD repeat protein
MKKNARSLCYLCLLLLLGPISLLAQGANNQAVLLRSGIVMLPANAPSFDQEGVISKNETVGDYFIRLIQFSQIPSADQHRMLQQAGIQLLDYVPHKAYIAAMPASIQSAQLEALGIRSIVPVPAHLKMADNLRDRPFPDWALRKGKVEVMMKYYASVSHEEAIAFCRADGIEVLKQNGVNNFMRVAIPEERLEEVSRLPYVALLELVAEPGQPDDVPGRGLHRANAIDTDMPSGRHYTGEEVKVLVRDDGFVGPHIDFHGRISQDVSEDSGVHHADNVSGIFAGAGNLDPRMRGMAAGSFLYVIDYEETFLDNTLSLHTDSEVLVTNSSYSNGCNTGYTANAATVDQQLFDNPTFLHVFSAGNSNNNNCDYGAGNQWGNITGGHKQAKNAIATANVFADASLVNSSSRGPAYDGRLKPDIAANGQDQMSTDPNNSYVSFGGTSGAAPGIAGITAQLHQAYREYNPGQIAEAALLKAIMLNTANDLGNFGPDFRFGWGHVNALRAAMTIEDGRYFSGLIDQGFVNDHTITIPDGVKEARIMVYWSDQEASELASKALVANLDIEILDQNSASYQPWVLDPTPDPVLLNAPATTGVDTLNNMEQVYIANPAAGDYSLRVTGTEVPFPGQKYWVVYEFVFDEITVTYPNGGEGLVPGETERIHWDATGTQGNFFVEYSTDGGGTWTVATTTTGDARMVLWTVPATITSKAHVRVTRDGISGQNQAPFSIVNVPANLQVTQACPEYIRLQWDAVEGATAYDVFLLGELYMDSVGTTGDLFYDVPTINFNPTLDHWLSVRAVGDEGLRSRRAIAIPYSEGLLNCVLDTDLAITEVVSPNAALTSCGSPEIPVVVKVWNSGQNEQSGAQVTFQVGAETPVTETIANPIASGDTLTYTFTAPATLSGSGNYDFKAWVKAAGPDQASFNDTLSRAVSAVVFPGAGEAIGVTEDFEGGVIPPEYWQIQNPDGDFTWEEREVTGANGLTTIAMRVANYDYSANGQEDALITLPFDLSEANETTSLTFDLAYAVYNLTQYWDALRIDLYTDCGQTFAGTVYYKEKDVLATIPPQTSSFTPNQANQWRKEVVNLSEFAGESVVLHFVNITGYGNNLYVDNINISNVAAPTAGFLPSATELCQFGFVDFQDASQGDNLTYSWNFGSGAAPPAASGPGPHTVAYNSAGTKTVRLIVNNGFLPDTAFQTIEVAPAPVANFGFSTANGTVTFTNNSQFGETYSWIFGDGNTSTEENPVHTYQESGSYTVVLTVANDCGEKTSSKLVTVVVSSVGEQIPDSAVRIMPNPSAGQFEVWMEGLQTQSVQLRVLDVAGRQLWTGSYDYNGGLRQPVDLSQAPKGVYWLMVQTDKAVKAYKIVIQ